jgi:hypothetical protein
VYESVSDQFCDGDTVFVDAYFRLQRASGPPIDGRSTQHGNLFPPPTAHATQLHNRFEQQSCRIPRQTLYILHAAHVTHLTFSYNSSSCKATKMTMRSAYIMLGAVLLHAHGALAELKCDTASQPLHLPTRVSRCRLYHTFGFVCSLQSWQRTAFANHIMLVFVATNRSRTRRQNVARSAFANH